MDAPPDDWDLLARASTDPCALEQLFSRHRHYVFRLAWGLLQNDSDANDVVQDVFFKMQTGRLKAAPRARFTTWLYRVTINTGREQGRRTRKTWGAAPAPEAADGLADAAADPARLDAREDLRRSLAALPLRQREVVLLRFFEGFDTQETAAILGCRAGTVKAHLHRATQTLRQVLSAPPNSGDPP
ncbi:MAG: RNA polymerase sigma factor [Pseudomonadota bacterium]